MSLIISWLQSAATAGFPENTRYGIYAEGGMLRQYKRRGRRSVLFCPGNTPCRWITHQDGNIPNHLKRLFLLCSNQRICQITHGCCRKVSSGRFMQIVARSTCILVNASMGRWASVFKRKYSKDLKTVRIDTLYYIKKVSVPILNRHLAWGIDNHILDKRNHHAVSPWPEVNVQA